MDHSPTPAKTTAIRLLSIDAYRGFVMLLMMGEVLDFCSVSGQIPGSAFWRFLCHQQSHIAWVGCTLHDLIQPSFSFLVGVALPFSIANRLAKGQSPGRLALHAWWRAILLVLLGVFLRSTHSKATNWTLEDTLSQIGLGYGFLFLLGLRPRRDQWIALGVVLVGYWAAFALYPLPGAAFDYAGVGVSAEWLKENGLSGFAAHWNKNSNAAWAFDTWFMNLLPREKPFSHNGGGYSTLSFVPTLGTMILGLLAGGVLRESEMDPSRRFRWFVIAGSLCLAAGWALGLLGVCPVVKRIWTPSWALFSGGWCFLFLGAFHRLTDVQPERRWTFPLVVVGSNSIAAYLMAHLFDGFIFQNLKTHLGQGFFSIAGPQYERTLHGAAVLLVLWLLLFWMHRRKIFLRI